MSRIKGATMIVTSAIMTLGFLFLLIAVCVNGGLTIDQLVLDNISAIRSDNLTSVIKIVTYLGQFIVLYLICIVVCTILFVKKDKASGIFVASSLVVSSIVSTIIKYLVRRPRPIPTIITDIGYSFPSAHSMLSLALYVSILVVIFKYVRPRWARILLTLAVIILEVTIVFTRLYLGVHYLSDCLAGLMLAGAIIPIIYMFTHSNWGNKAKN